MTTWEDSYYKDDLISNLCRYANKTHEQAETLLKYFDPKYSNIAALNLPQRTLDRPKKLLKMLFPHYGTKTDKQILPTILEICNRSKQVIFGLEATYKLMNIVYKGKFIMEEQSQVKFRHNAAIETVRIDHAVSLGSRHKIKELVEDLELPSDIRSHVGYLSDSANALTHISFAWRAPDYRDAAYKAKRKKLAYPAMPKALIRMPKNWNCFSFPNCIMLLDESKGPDDIITYILTHKDVQKLETLIRSMIRAIRYYYLANKHANYPLSNSKLLGYFTLFIESLIATDRYNDVAKAWDIVYTYKFSLISMDIWDKSKIEQEKKFELGNYHKIIGLQTHLTFTKGLSDHEMLDFLKLYKVLPPPDYDPTSGFLKNKEYHDNPWTYGVPHPDSERLTPDLKLSDEEFYRFQVLQLFRRYYRLFKTLPGKLIHSATQHLVNYPHSKLHKFPTVNPDKLTDEEIDMIDYENAVPWEYRNTTAPDYYADKACPPNNRDLNTIKDGAEYYKLPLYERNFLMHYLTVANHPTTHSITQGNNYLLYQQTAHFKSESKKPDPRNFFSAKPDARLCMSEWEYNVEKYLGKDIAAFISKDPHDRAQALHSLLGEDYNYKNNKIVFVSFDLDKWSPRFSHDGKVASTRVWSKFFDSPTAKVIPQLAHNIDLHYFHNGLHFNYKTKTLDAEGQWGKTNTVFHEDVMAFAVRILRRLKLIQFPGKLAVFIDDGLLTLKFPQETTNSEIQKVLLYIEHIYHFYGFHISWDKTFVSQYYCQFLAESYYQRNHIDLPFRAFLKMQKTKVMNELSPNGQIKSLCSMARSSVMLGVPTHLVLYELCQEVYSIMSKNIRESVQRYNLVPLELAIMGLTPTSLKGLGIPFTASWLQNPASNQIENYFGVCEYLGTIVPTTSKTLISILNQKGKIRTPLSLLRAPNSFRVEGHCLSDMKHYKLVAPIMKTFAKNPLLTWVFSCDLDTLAKNLVNMLPDACEESEIQAIYEMSPIAQFDKFLSKIKRGNTVLSLLTWRGKRALTNAYYYESSAVFKEFISLVRPLR